VSSDASTKHPKTDSGTPKIQFRVDTLRLKVNNGYTKNENRESEMVTVYENFISDEEKSEGVAKANARREARSDGGHKRRTLDGAFCFRQLAAVQDLFDAGAFSGCKIVSVPMGEGVHLFFGMKEMRGGQCGLSSKRDPHNPKVFKSIDSAVSTAFKIGFEDVRISRN